MVSAEKIKILIFFLTFNSHVATFFFNFKFSAFILAAYIFFFFFLASFTHIEFNVPSLLVVECA